MSHQHHSNCPDSLACLLDVGPTDRPKYTLATILRCAILGSTGKMMTLGGMYTAIEEKFPYYRTVKAWRGSVRHQLSLNSLFKRVQQPRASYWTVDLDAERGNKRLRKRGRKLSSKTQGLSVLLGSMSLYSISCAKENTVQTPPDSCIPVVSRLGGHSQMNLRCGSADLDRRRNADQTLGRRDSFIEASTRSYSLLEFCAIDGDHETAGGDRSFKCCHQVLQ
ncbi:hypothetical protein B0H11DRAFT_1736628 [Mycena galericulata]|nr:hypothetical protein B0H11DRAFT_1736628 [Mycena galericulata]